ncbi:uncharacterized protein MONBRDRAFT_28764 [Monosiga brevicollis MX1]|uniref:Uncharacterized protein n=1 Tax=Monosiga brevicollis TaxID=81824 RepID=A9V945_MONBE|nr:uncharacterized protein MONBRDRAFT_28764 [Monosiga brevicollis MX1]EDQ85990.1 predicted protein [Monosiga brevicollis MX1]|eukprot:XP_001749184.1 hypothetical protein [Monosiga brevicollis MX1]
MAGLIPEEMKGDGLGSTSAAAAQGAGSTLAGSSSRKGGDDFRDDPQELVQSVVDGWNKLRGLLSQADSRLAIQDQAWQALHGRHQALLEQYTQQSHALEALRDEQKAERACAHDELEQLNTQLTEAAAAHSCELEDQRETLKSTAQALAIQEGENVRCYDQQGHLGEAKSALLEELEDQKALIAEHEDRQQQVTQRQEQLEAALRLATEERHALAHEVQAAHKLGAKAQEQGSQTRAAVHAVAAQAEAILQSLSHASSGPDTSTALDMPEHPQSVASQEWHRAEAQSTRLLEQLNSERQQKADLEQTLAEVGQRLAELRETAADALKLEAERTRWQVAHGELEHELAQTESKLHKQREQALSERAQLESATRLVEQQLTTQGDALTACQSRLAARDEELQEATRKLEELEVELKSRRQREDVLEEQVQSTSHCLQMQVQERTQQEHAATDAAHALETLGQDRDRWHRKYLKQTEELKMARQQAAVLHRELAAARRDLHQCKEQALQNLQRCQKAEAQIRQEQVAARSALTETNRLRRQLARHTGRLGLLNPTAGGGEKRGDQNAGASTSDPACVVSTKEYDYCSPPPTPPRPAPSSHPQGEVQAATEEVTPAKAVVPKTAEAKSVGVLASSGKTKHMARVSFDEGQLESESDGDSGDTVPKRAALTEVLAPKEVTCIDPRDRPAGAPRPEEYFPTPEGQDFSFKAFFDASVAADQEWRDRQETGHVLPEEEVLETGPPPAGLSQDAS